MRTSTNIIIQLVAVVGFVAFRLAAPGWILIIFFFTLIGPVLMLVPPALAIGTARRRRLETKVAVPFVLCAALLVITAAVYPDFGDTSGAYIPVIPGPTHGPVADAAVLIGTLAGLGFVAAVVWTSIAVAVTRRRRVVSGGTAA